MSCTDGVFAEPHACLPETPDSKLTHAGSKVVWGVRRARGSSALGNELQQQFAIAQQASARWLWKPGATMSDQRGLRWPELFVL
jgi:hypothetical protein